MLFTHVASIQSNLKERMQIYVTVSIIHFSGTSMVERMALSIVPELETLIVLTPPSQVERKLVIRIISICVADF